jgi:hypothetical protein
MFDSSFTLEAWMAYESFNSFSHWFSIGNGPSTDNIYIGNSGSGNTVRYGTVYNPFGNSTSVTERLLEQGNGYSVGVFSHIVVTCNLISPTATTGLDVTTLNLYINGVFIKNTTAPNTRAVARSQQYLGRSNWASDGFFNGWLDAFHIYNYALSDQSVFGHYYLRRVPVYELAFSEDPRQIAGTSATYSYVLADPADVTANVSQWHQGVVTLNGVDQYMDLAVNSGSSTSGTVLPSFGGAGFGTGTNGFNQGWTFEFTFKTPSVVANSKIFDTATSTGSDRVYLGFDASSQLVFSTQFGTGTATPTTILSSVTTGTWYHVIVVVNPVSVTAGTATHVVYVNGVNTINSTSAAYVASATRSAAFMGKSTASSETAFANVVFDLVRIYDYAITNNTAGRLYYSVSQAIPVEVIPPIQPYATAPRNLYSFDAQHSVTGYSIYDFINMTADNHFGVAAFNGLNSSVNLLYFPDANNNLFPEYIGGTGMSFCTWAKWTTLGSWSRIFDFGGLRGIYDSNIILANREGTNNLIFQVYSGNQDSNIIAENVIQPGKWHHICATVTLLNNNVTSPLATNLTLYVDGALRRVGPGYIPPRVRRGNLLVGRSQWNDARFHGYMDSIAFYEYTLDAQQVYAHSCTVRPPAYEFAFTRDPRSLQPSVTFNYGWQDTDAEIIPANTKILNPTNSPITFIHTGILTFNGSAQYANLTATNGATSLGNPLPIIGGAGSGVGNFVGWTFELMVKANTRATWSKAVDLGVGTNGDDDIIFGFRDNSGEFAFEVLNSAVRVGTSPKSTRTVLIPNLTTGKWYHIVVVVTPLDTAAATAIWTPYVDGESLDAVNGTWPRAVGRTNANLAKSNWADQYFNGSIDTFRVYDYALNENHVLCLYRSSRSVTPIALPDSLYHPGPMNSYSFQANYDTGVRGIASYTWVPTLDGRSGVATFDGTTQHVNLMGFPDSRGSTMPIVFGGTDLTFEGWVRYSTNRSYSRVFDISNGQSTQNIVLSNRGSTPAISFHLYSSNGFTQMDTNFNWTMNAWTHYVVTVTRNTTNAVTANNAATYRLYINGVLLQSMQGYYATATARYRNYLGRSAWSGDAYFNGAMDSFSWYDYALPADAVKVHFGLTTPPYFELTFTTDPRSSTVATTPFGYGWVDRDPRDPVNTLHQGLLDLSALSRQHVDLQQTRGNQSLGFVLPQIGGFSSGVGDAAGWSFEIVFLLRNVSLSWCKFFDTGNGANPSGTPGDDSIIFGLRNDRTFTFEVYNSRALPTSTIATILPSARENVWYSVVVTMRPSTVATSRATYNVYLNGVLNSTIVEGTNLQGIYRENAFIGKSEWASDPTCDGQLDAFRIYDYALTSAEVATLATNTVETPLPIVSSTGAAASSSSSSSSATPSSSSSSATPSSSSSSSATPASSSSSSSASVSSSSSSAPNPTAVPSSSSTGTNIPQTGCAYNGDVPDGSVRASLILAKPLSSFSPSFGQAFQSVVLGLAGNAPANRFACLGTVGGPVASADPEAGQTKVDFAFLNNGAETDPKPMDYYNTFSNNFGQFNSRMANALDSSYVATGNPEYSIQESDGSSGLSDGAIAGIVIGSVVGGLLLLVLLVLLCRRGSKRSDSTYRTKHRDEVNRDAHIHDHEVDTDGVEMQGV